MTGHLQSQWEEEKEALEALLEKFPSGNRVKDIVFGILKRHLQVSDCSFVFFS